MTRQQASADAYRESCRRNAQLAASKQLPPGHCLQVLVKYSCGAYVTSTVQGKRASATHSAGEAVLRLGRKLWGAEPQTTLVEHRGAGVEVWHMAPPPPPAP